MAKFNYVAMDSTGKETKGVLDVGSQAEALNRLKEMGFLPTKVTEVAPPKSDAKGGKGFPNLSDAIWKFDGSPDGILATVKGGVNVEGGRVAAMRVPGGNSFDLSKLVEGPLTQQR